MLASTLGALQPSNASERQAVAGVDLSAFALPDGTLPVICFGNGAPEDVAFQHCDDCRAPVLFSLLGHGADREKMAQISLINRLHRSDHMVASHSLRNDNSARAPPRLS